MLEEYFQANLTSHVSYLSFLQDAFWFFPVFNVIFLGLQVLLSLMLWAYVSDALRVSVSEVVATVRTPAAVTSKFMAGHPAVFFHITVTSRTEAGTQSQYPLLLKYNST